MKSSCDTSIGAIAVLLAAMLLPNLWAHSALPTGGVEIMPFSWDTSSDSEQKLDAILHESDAIAAAMIASDLAWLPTEIGNTVGMAPFTENRKTCFNKAVAIAKVVLSEGTHVTPTLDVLAMPSRCLLILDDTVYVNPSYGEQELIELLSEYREDSNPEVRLFVFRQIGRLGIVDSEFRASAIDFMEGQDEIEQNFLVAAGREPDYMEGNRSVIENFLGTLKGTIRLKFSAAIISDVQYQAVLMRSREDLLELVGDGDTIAWMVLRKSPFTQEEETALLEIATKNATSGLKLEILQALTYGIRKDQSLEVELARIDRLLAWYRANSIQTDPNVSFRRAFVGMLYGLGQRGRDGVASREYRRKASTQERRLREGKSLSPDFDLYNPEIHLERRHGDELVTLLEQFLNDSDDEVRKDAERALIELRSIYKR